MKRVSRWSLAIFLLAAGTMHFVLPDLYGQIVPPYLPWPLALVYLSGVAELVVGAGLLAPRFSRRAAWACIALLVAVFPANLYLYQHQEILPAPPALHLLRLPLQAAFVLWAYWHTRP